MGGMAWRFLKGHGTENDFVLLPDPDGALDLTATRVAALCDRRSGVGGDGVLRVVRASADPDSAAMAADAEWFMDYRNADGSLSQMCGNGIRVFGRYLVAAGLAEPGPIPVATRGGVRLVTVPADGAISVEMGRPTVATLQAAPTVAVRDGAGERTWPATSVSIPNPHAVTFVDHLADAGPLADAPLIAPSAMFPEGANVEFVVVRKPGHLAMRVHERGVGETRSCGTGACAAAIAARRREGDGSPRLWRVDVPGGTVHVDERADGEVVLSGPAVLVAEGLLDEAWLADHP
jgi:diaminopimelate epimerase